MEPGDKEGLIWQDARHYSSTHHRSCHRRAQVTAIQTPTTYAPFPDQLINVCLPSNFHPSIVDPHRCLSEFNGKNCRPILLQKVTSGHEKIMVNIANASSSSKNNDDCWPDNRLNDGQNINIFALICIFVLFMWSGGVSLFLLLNIPIVKNSRHKIYPTFKSFQKRLHNFEWQNRSKEHI